MPAGAGWLKVSCHRAFSPAAGIASIRASASLARCADIVVACPTGSGRAAKRIAPVAALTLKGDVKAALAQAGDGGAGCVGLPAQGLADRSKVSAALLPQRNQQIAELARRGGGGGR